jgi:class 3 adenylate cyclase
VPPTTQYAKSGDINIAYQVLGDGPIDLVYVWGWLSHLDLTWTEPTLATFLRRLASFSRLIMFDKRGTGLSDPIGAAPTFEERMEDIRVVMDAVGSERAALLGFSEGTAMSALFAATYPERTSALILYDGLAAGTYAKGDDADPDWVASAEMVRDTIDHWGEGRTMEWQAPSLQPGGALQRFYGTFERASMSPGMARALWDAIQNMDVRAALPAITAPTLVLHHAESRIPASLGREMADLIPGARYHELPGKDHLPGAGDPEAIAGEIEEFLTGARGRGEAERVLATILFTDIVDSTRRAAELGDRAWRELLERHDALVRSQLERFRGIEVKQTGDGFVARFDGPARAIRCATAIGDEGARLGIEIRAGIHTGECELIGDDIGGVAVHVAARVGALAGPREVLVSGTVKDLVLGSGIDLADRGAHTLKGVPGEWRLFSVADGAEPARPERPAVEVSHEPPVLDRIQLRLARSAPGLGRGTARVLQRRRSRS